MQFKPTFVKKKKNKNKNKQIAYISAAIAAKFFYLLIFFHYERLAKQGKLIIRHSRTIFKSKFF